MNYVSLDRLIQLKLDQFNDHRGKLKFLNSIDLSKFKRFYFINHHSKNQVRAWQGHPSETKIFVPIRGKFLLATVKIDNFYSPNFNLKPKVFNLDSALSSAVIVPKGHANGLKSINFDSEVLVYSEFELSKSKKDKIRFDKDLWLNWDEY